MSIVTVDGETVSQDPEDVFELAGFYGGTSPLDRTWQPLDEPLEFHVQAEHVLSLRRQNPADYEAAVAAALSSSAPTFATHFGHVPDPAAVLAGVDVADLDAQTPLQAALVDSILLPESVYSASVIDLWTKGRSLAFAMEAFAEYSAIMGLVNGDFFAHVPGNNHFRPRWAVLRLLERVRGASAVDRAELLATAEHMRRDEPGPATRSLTSFLFPERPEWFWADLDAADRGAPSFVALLPSVSTAAQASALAKRFRGLTDWQWDGESHVELTFLTVAGAEALPVLTAWCDSGHRCPSPRKGRPQPCPIHRRSLGLIARTPGDAAMSVLVQWIDRDGVGERLQAAVKRFPRRALRILAEAAPTEEITRLLTMVVLDDPDRARAEAARVSPEAWERIEALLDDDTPDVEALDLPEILAAPPWRDKKRKRAKPVVIEGLTAPAEVTVDWLRGERETRLTLHGAGWTPEQGWKAVLPEILDGTANEHLATYFAAYAPDELVRPQLLAWQPPMRQVTDRARTFVAKYELLALPTVLSLTRFPAVRAQLLQPFASAEIAAIMADGLVRLRSVRTYAISWLRRHPEDAVRGLVPTALGKPGKLRQNTVAALRWLEADGVDVVTITQQTYGEEAATAAKEVMADRGIEACPRTVPPSPMWARAALLAEIRLKDGKTPLPRSAAQAVLEMLMFSKPDAPYGGLEIVKELCDATSLAEFVWSLAQTWDLAGGDEEDRWVVGALGVFGDQTTVARLEELIRAWHRRSKPENVCDGLDALAMIGGDRALTALHGFAGRSWTMKLKRKARTTFEDVAESLDLSPDRLADRLVPTSGLTAEGTVRLDYGRRCFDVSFDDYLRPVVTDEAGTVLRTMPKPGKRDDAEPAAASYKRFTTLKKQVQDGAQEQAARMERAIFQRRRWIPAEFAEYVVRHLVLGRIARRLVWGVYSEDGVLLGSFRIAEDLSFADVDDAHYEVPEGALIGVAHPVDLGLTLGRWSEVFGDYEVLQPFNQLGRLPLVLDAEDRARNRLVRQYISPDVVASAPAGYEVRFGPTKFELLATRGWHRGPIADRRWARLLRPVGDGKWVVMDLVPGLEAGAVALSPLQAITAVWLSATGNDPDIERHALPLAGLDALSASVVLRDLEEIWKDR
ncbi:DUF4132 domain-containing protein [Catenulispora rubra]|uniref:DUF4132 domain-containing protein n=1 Tax=Catenulispora rubra TaxID=280293 RepID=UPI0018922252|nr:DUF4132 domain-containing protein [Catenulispora rubra]